MKNPEVGYATDFVTVAMRAVLKRRGRHRASASSATPAASTRRAAPPRLQALAAEHGVAVKIAVVEGDDVLPLLPQLRARRRARDASGAPLPERLLTANAYLGALPIAARRWTPGAEVVITGRCVDSAVTLGALMHEFGWAPTTTTGWRGSLAGHIIECGCQATGGLHTDWEACPTGRTSATRSSSAAPTAASS